jgi:hypothetical protein
MESFLGMPIEVGMDRFVLAQVFGLLTLAFNFWAYQMEDQRKYFLRFTIGSVFWLAMFATIGAQVPVLLVASVSTLRGIVFWWALGEDSPWRRMIARRTLYATLILAVVAAIPAIPAAREGTRLLQFVLLIGVLLFVIGQYMPGVYLVRFGAVFYAISLILVNSPLDTFNPIGIIIELNNILAVAVFFVVLARKTKERRRLAALRPAALTLGQPVAAR